MMPTTKSPPIGTTRYLPALTGLRAVAAYLVFGHHYNPAPIGTIAYRLLAQGYVGVTIFFVLSGFLIYHRYADAFLGDISWSWKGYLQNRFARIYPLYALLLFLTFTSDVERGNTSNWLLCGLNLTLLKGLFADYKFTGIAQSWSLTVEACFYLLAPLLFVALRSCGLLLLTVFLLTFGLFLWLTVGSLNWHGLFGSVSFVLFYTVFGRGFEFIMGMWLAHRWHENRLPSLPFPTMGGIGLISGCVLWQACIPTFITNPTGLIWSEALVYNYLLPVGVVLLILGLIRERTILKQLLATPVAQGLGRSSYAFYLIHIGIVSRLLQRGLPDNRWILFVVLILIAHGLYLSVEKPVQHWLRTAIR